MAHTSAMEQWLLEFINRARLDPLGTAARFGVTSLNEGLEPGTISAGPKAVVAMSDILQATADFHSQYSLERGSFETTGAYGSDPGDRMAFAGFNDGEAFTWAETINWRTFATQTQIDEITFAYNIARDLFVDPQTRALILADNFNEIGLSLEHGPLGGSTTEKSYVVVNDMAGSDETFITGGVYRSTYFETFMLPPEGIGNIAVSADTATTTSNDAGGYRVQVSSGAVAFNIGDVSLTVPVDGENIKIDLIGTSHIRADHSIGVRSGAVMAELIGIRNANIIAEAASGVASLYGNSGNNRLVGSNANNYIDGRGGIDTMEGGRGDDRYIVDSADDVVREKAGAGDDTVVTSVSYTLKSDAEVETLKTMHDIFTDPIELRGNGFSQLIFGNHGANTLDGRGGGDRLFGSLGDDLYIVRSASDQIEEYSGEGQDTARSAVSFVLAANDSIESLMTIDGYGTAAINLTGNDFAQLIMGNAGANTLKGLGGVDRLEGRGGNDTLHGGNGDDTLFGGLGNDTLTGGAGVDGFYFLDAPGAANADVLTDFKTRHDRLYLERDAFTELSGTRLATHQFKDTALAAIDSSDRIIFDRPSGNLYYDADGSGAGAAQLFATLTNDTIVSVLDFWLV